MVKEIISIIIKDVQLEWRNKFSLVGIFIQVLSAVFIVYLAIPSLNDATQNSLFWIIIVFSSLNPLAKSFLGDTFQTNNYYKQLIRPEINMRAKLIYNLLLINFIIFLVWGTFNLLIGNENGNKVYYLLSLLLAGSAISASFTLMSAMANKVKNGFLVLPVISLPIIIPVLLVGIKSSKKAMDDFPLNLMYSEWLLQLMLAIFCYIMAEILYIILEEK